MGLDADRTDSALRISFSRFNTTDEIDALCDALTEAQNTLRKKGH
jgi:cysteine sulfinate desulfinase/cysteine desulfurase-like protein